jgi:TonB family protein
MVNCELGSHRARLAPPEAGFPTLAGRSLMNAWRLHLTALSVIVVCLFANALAQTSTDAGSKTKSTSGIEKVGGRVSAPRLVYGPDPEYSAEALDSKYEGFCVLSVVVGTDGRPSDIKIVQELGHGLDEKAVEAVKEWKFEPAMKDSKPVAVQIYVQVQFHRNELFDSDPQENSAKPAAQLKKLPHYTQQQAMKLYSKCAPYLDIDGERPEECREFIPWMLSMEREQFATAGQAKTVAQQISDEAAAQANKMPSYSQEQLTDLRVKCAPYTKTKVEDLVSKKAPLPPHDCRGVLEWMRDPRVDALYTSEKSPQ